MHLSHKFKFSIGDKVSLMHPYYGNYICTSKEVTGDNVYTICEIGYSITEEKDSEGFSEKAYYILHAYMDNNVGYHTHVSEDNLIPIGENKPFTLEYDTKSIYDEDLNIGDKIYDNIFRRAWNDYNKIIIDSRLTFSSYSKIKGFIIGITSEGYKLCQIKLERLFPCNWANGMPREDGDALGTIRTSSTSYVCKQLPENYIEQYVKACISDGFYPLSYDDGDDMKLVRQWFNFFGQGKLEEMLELYNQKKRIEKTEIEKKKESTKEKINAILNGLTEEEKIELFNKLKN